MSFDSLYQQILLTEQQLAEQNLKLKETTITIMECKEKIKTASMDSQEIKQNISDKAQQLGALQFEKEVMQKCEEMMTEQLGQLMTQSSVLQEEDATLMKINKETEDNLLQEISNFNNDFGLHGDTAMMFQSQTVTNLQAVTQDIHALCDEMDGMSSSNACVSGLEEEEKVLNQELQELEATYTELNEQLEKVCAIGGDLTMESVLLSQKHLSDELCGRLRDELHMYMNNQQVDDLRDQLVSEIKILQSEHEGMDEDDYCFE